MLHRRQHHGYADPGRSPKAPALERPGKIVIGDDCWIGAHVCVVGNIRIGRHCVVGANAVVTGVFARLLRGGRRAPRA
jgi:acetyltransferase-like isoleucine patch superfamily enzyme